MTSTPPNINRWRAFALLAVSFFMTVIDLTIVNVSLPTIGRDLHFSATNLQWVVTAYALTFGGFMLLGGRAADLLGRRRILMVGLSLFTAASLGAALSTGELSLIAARAVQGLGAAVMLPAALSIVMNMFAEGAERNKALGIWGGLGAGGATVGVIAGGLLTTYAGWQYIFYLNVPIGAAVLALAPRIVPDSRLAATHLRFDALGAIAAKKNVTRAQIALAWLLAQRPWIVPIPGTTKLHRLEENIGAVSVELTPDDLHEIDTAASKIQVQGARYPERLEQMTGR